MNRVDPPGVLCDTMRSAADGGVQRTWSICDAGAFAASVFAAPSGLSGVTYSE